MTGRCRTSSPCQLFSRKHRKHWPRVESLRCCRWALHRIVAGARQSSVWCECLDQRTYNGIRSIRFWRVDGWRAGRGRIAAWPFMSVNIASYQTRPILSYCDFFSGNLRVASSCLLSVGLVDCRTKAHVKEVM